MTNDSVRRALGMGLLVIMLAWPVQASSQDDGITCYKDKDVDRAIAACTRVTRNSKESLNNRAIAFNNRGARYRAKGDYDRAITDISEAIRLKAQPSFYWNRGMAYNGKGDEARAKADFGEMIRFKAK